MNDTVTFLSLNGLLGYGYPIENLEKAFSGERTPEFIGVDAGSTDPGPYYLGSGTSFVSMDRVAADLEPALITARRHDIPLIIGTAGGSGARPHVDSFVESLLAISKKHSLRYRLAVIYTDMDRSVLHAAATKGCLEPCGGAPDIGDTDIGAICNPVAQVGTEPIIAALESGADVIVCGRCCDTAIFASYPILRGFDPALALHCAKIAECGTLCADPGSAADSLLCTIGRDSFTVVPVNAERRCTPTTVAAHSLYEQPDPRCFVEPEGIVDLSRSVYRQQGTRSVVVSGTTLIETHPGTIKLEGAALAGYRSISIAGICDPAFLASFDDVENQVRRMIESSFPVDGNPRYSIHIRRYGIETLRASIGAGTPITDEAAIIIEVVAAREELAKSIVSFARSSMLHQAFPGRKTTAGNLAFPYSPSDISCGPVYEFGLYHLLDIEAIPIEFPVRYIEVE